MSGGLGSTVLSLVQSACYELNIPAPAALFGTTNVQWLQYLNLFYAVGRDLRQAKCWVQLKRTHSFTTSNGVSQYALPSDFYCSILDTYWDTTNRWKMAGPQTDARFNELLYGYAAVSNREYFRIFGRPYGATGEVQVYPTPGPTNLTLSFDYIASTWIYQSSNTTWYESIQADTNQVAFDDDLMILGFKARWLQAKGLDFTPYQQEYATKVDAAQARWQGNKKGTMYTRALINAGLDPNIPEGNFTL